MANRIQIRHGPGTPTTANLLPYELGWDNTNHVLYIREESGDPFRIGGSGTLSVAQGGTGATSFTANSLIISGSTTTSALTTRGITNNDSATAAAIGTNIPTMNTLYYALPNINGAKTYHSNSNFYAPTTAGTSGYILTSTGGAPGWTQTLPVTNGGTGLTTSTNVNAIITGNSTTATDAFTTIRTNNGALYATSQDGAATFGTLPVAQGGTGQTSISNIQAGKDGDGNTISSTYLKLSGGTMTGDLSLKNNDIDITALGAIEDYYNNLFFKDTNNLNSAYVQNSQDTDGTISLTLASIHRDTDDSDNINNTLTLSATDSDTAITVSHPKKWREGLKICKFVGTLASGGTLSFSDVDKYTFYMSCSASNGYVWYGMKRSATSILFRGYNQTSDYAYAVTNSVTISGTTLTASSTLTYRNGSKQSDNHPAIGDVYAIA